MASLKNCLKKFQNFEIDENNIFYDDKLGQVDVCIDGLETATPKVAFYASNFINDTNQKFSNAIDALAFLGIK